MTTSRPFATTSTPTPHKPLAFAVCLLAAVLALLAAAGSAHGEGVEAVSETPAQVVPAVAAAAPEAPAPSEPVQAPAEEAPPPPPAPPASIAQAPSEAADVPAAVTSATEPDQTSSPSPATIPVRQVSKLVEDGSHGSAERIGRKLTNTVAAVAGQADAAVKGFASEPLLLTGNFVRGALTLVESTVGDLLAPAAPLLQAVGAPGSSRSLPPAAGPVSLSPQGTTGWSPAPSIAAPGVVETVAAASEAAEPFAGRWEASPVSAPATSASLLPRAGGGSAGGPTPSDVPSPAPGSPGAVASGSGGPIFVPIAALLALLALAAPAALRRLREVPDFRPPIPFVCALERPG